MAQLTSEGLVIRRYPEIVRVIQSALTQQVSSEMDFSEDTLISKIVDIMANELSVMEAMLQQLNDSKDRDKAEGSSLDELLYLIGLKRQNAVKSSGYVQTISADNSVIPNRTIAINVSNGDRFITTEAGIVSKFNCQAVWVKPSVMSSTTFSIDVLGSTYNYTSDANATITEIIDGLVDAINGGMSDLYTAQNSSDQDGEFLLINSTDNRTNIGIDFTQNMTVAKVKTLIPIEAVDFGAIIAPPNVITEVVSGVSGLYSLTNEEALGLGRLLETDAEFKIRASRSLSLSGSATYSALFTAISNLDGVSNLVLLENSTMLTDIYSLPPKSFEVIVDVPDTPEFDALIANTIWEEKPLGIESHGDEVVTIKDETNVDRVLKFSRPTPIYIAMKVEYKEYDEEDQVVNISDVIKDSVIDNTVGLSTGKDLIPSKFTGGVYSATQSGIGEVVVYAQTIATEDTAPDAMSWSTSKIAISPKQYAAVLRKNVSVELTT